MTHNDADTAPRSRRSRWKVAAVVVVVLLLVLFVAAEIGARITVGLGNPPLFVHDPAIEYYYKPDGNYLRRGNHIRINNFGMRADDMSATQSSPAETRIVVMGDSIVFGGTQSDQPAIATELLKDRLTQNTTGPVLVGNISAGSWGPQNQLHYLEKFGTFDADVVLWVLNWADAADVIDPEGPPTEQSHPTRKPWLALQELWQTLMPAGSSGPPAERPMVVQPEVLAATRAVLDRLEADGVPVIVLLHPPRADEVNPEQSALREAFLELFRQRDVSVVDLLYSGPESYRDAVHPNDQGNVELADQLYDAVGLKLPMESTGPTGPTGSE